MCSSYDQAKSDLRLKCDVVGEAGEVCEPGGHLDSTILQPLSRWGHLARQRSPNHVHVMRRQWGR
jgi:hypothetical protein